MESIVWTISMIDYDAVEHIFENLIRRAGERGYLKNYSSVERGPTHIPFDYILMKNFRSYG